MQVLLMKTLKNEWPSFFSSSNNTIQTNVVNLDIIIDDQIMIMFFFTLSPVSPTLLSPKTPWTPEFWTPDLQNMHRHRVVP